MHVIYEIKDLMEDELKQMSRKEQLTKDDVCLIGEMIDIVKDIVTIEAMKNYDEDRENAEAMRNYSRGYDMDYSYARGRDMRGRYTSRDDGYTKHSSKEEMISNLRNMMDNARTPEERESYRNMIDQMNR